MRFSPLSLLLLTTSTQGFTPPLTSHQNSLPNNPTTTKLNAHPPFIIGPFIRKMREKKAKENQPLASDDEKATEAPGLKIGTGVWKWPPVWPYEDRLFKRASETEAAPAPNPMAMMAGGGLPDLTQAATTTVKEEDKVDFMKFWAEDMKEVKTGVDEEAKAALQGHYSYYIKDGMSILELGAAEESYLPTDLKPSRHVGVSLSSYLMEQNPSLTERLIVDLNDVEEELGVDSDALRELGENTFDVIVCSNTVEFLTSPREVFRSAFRLLKPDGIMMVSFVNKNAFEDTYKTAQTNMWEQFNDDQHIWVTGSFFQFSAEDGWVGLKGFDISPDKSEKQKNAVLGKLFDKDKPMNMYVVQATKDYCEEGVDESDVEGSFRKKMWTVRTLESRDKALVLPRLARSYSKMAEDEERKDALIDHVDLLPTVYESLIKMDQFAFPFSLQAQLAVDLVADKDFTASAEQMTALKMGLGLRKPSAEFWEPVGTLTASMPPDEKVSLLSFVVPRFGSSSPEELNSFVTGLKPTFALLRQKCPKLSEPDIQIIGSELLACEIITGRSTRLEFGTWLNELTEDEVNTLLTTRKSYRETAMTELKDMQEERQRKKDEEEAVMKKYQDQVKKAKQERSMYFNEETGKMESIQK